MKQFVNLKAPNAVPLFAVKTWVRSAGLTTWVIPSGATLTEYALAESGKLGGESYFKLCGNPIEEVGKFILYIYYIIDLDFYFIIKYLYYYF